MVTIYINGNVVHARDDATVLEASREDFYATKMYDIRIPSLQYLKDVKKEDSSGLCSVLVEGMDGLVNASEIPVKEGMHVSTREPEVREAWAHALEGILEQHDLDCRNCLRTGNCELQELQHDLRITKDPEHARNKRYPIDQSGIILRDDNKCIRCGRCISVCENIQSIGAIEFQGEDTDRKVVPAGADHLKDTKCVNCGQCIAVCPVGALHERDDVDRILEAIADPEKYVVIQAAPSLRAGISEYFHYPVGAETKGKLAAALRRIGFDRVFDAVFGADLTIMEEAHEFTERLGRGETLPMITSCCPGWISFCEEEYPDLLPHISSCKSPQQMFGAAAKSFLAEKTGIPKENMVVVSAMPCTAKKYELSRDHESGAGVPDVDFSITARELGRLIERCRISFMSLPDEEFDSPLGMGTGAGTIFGATGGVMEAALRTAADSLTGEAQQHIDYTQIRGMEGIKEAVYKIGNREIKVAAASGLANARVLLDQIREGTSEYSFIEIMACPGGCVNGGGQPQQNSSLRSLTDIRRQRAASLYQLDQKAPLRKSHENPEIITLYEEYLGTPGSEKAHALLHTVYQAQP